MHDVVEMYRWAANSELFAGIPGREIAEMICRARTLEFVSGDVIHSADDPVKQVLLLIEGRVKKSQFSGNGHEVVFRLCVPGEVISEPILQSRRKHSANVLALERCKALAWESTNFKEMVERSPSLLKNVELILKSRLLEVTQRFYEASTKAVPPRLAIGLIDLAGRIGERVNNHIELRVSQETLGQMTGMTPNSVWRLLSIWKAQGIVKVRRGTIEIHDLPHLMSCAQLAQTSAQNALSGDAVVVPGTTLVGADNAASQVAGD